jgi:uncharacterized protein
MHIIIFAKAPVPGNVKTRMIPALGAEGAAMLHMALVERAITTAKRASKSIELCCTPDSEHAFFEDMQEEFDLALTSQVEGDLGARMHAALTRALDPRDEHTHVVLIGADAASLSPNDLKAADAALKTHDIAIAPAEDGGYVLIAAKRVAPTMFRDIDWGQEHVFAQQTRALSDANLSLATLGMQWDVDRPQDLDRLRTLQPPLAFAL